MAFTILPTAFAKEPAASLRLPSPNPATIQPNPATQTAIAAPSPQKTFTLTADESITLFAQARTRGLPLDGLLFIADTATQRATLIDADGIQFEYAMSSSKYGTGNRMDSNQTPIGWHKVVERIGGDKIQGTSFTSRRPDRVVLPPSEWRSNKERDYVLTRILWLRGLESGINLGGNVDSYNRCIYIHGTNQEHLLGTPASHGCLRLSNRDVMELFDYSEGRELYCLIR